MEGLTFGSMLTIENVTAETTTDATPRKLASFNTNGAVNRTTVDHTTNNITIVETGIYNITCMLSFSGTLSKTFFAQAYKNITPIGIACERKLGTGGDVGSASFGAPGVALTAGDTVSVYHWSDDGGTSFVAHQVCLEILRVA